MASPTGNTVAGHLPTTTLWAFSDLSGSVRSLGMVNAANAWVFQHRNFDTWGNWTGNATDTYTSPNANAAAFLTDVDAIWNGRLREPTATTGISTAPNLYLAGGRAYDPQLTRFLTPGEPSLADPNPYTLDGNNPVDGRAENAFWQSIEGPNAFSGVGAFGYGAWDAVTFGHFDDVFGTQGAQEQAAQNGYYYAGLGFGVAAQVALGNYAVGALLAGANATRLGYAGARAYQGYSLAGDAVGVYDSYQAVRSGNFGAMDLLGFAPTIGWASRGVGGLRAMGSVPPGTADKLRRFYREELGALGLPDDLNQLRGEIAPSKIGAKRGPKTDINAPHNATIRSQGDLLEAGGNTVIAGGGTLPERFVPTPGGLKEGRRPDILFETQRGQLRGRNVGLTDAAGNPVKRELDALKDLNGPGGIPTDFVPYD